MVMDPMQILPTISSNKRGRYVAISVGLLRNGITSRSLKQGSGKIGSTHVDKSKFLGFDRLCMVLALQCLDLYLTTEVRRGAFEQSRALLFQHIQVFYMHIRVLVIVRKLSAEQLLDLEVQITTARVQVGKINCTNMAKFVVKAKQTINKSLDTRNENLRRSIHKHFEGDLPKTLKPTISAPSQPRLTVKSKAGKPLARLPVPTVFPSVGNRTLIAKLIGKVSRLKKTSNVREPISEPDEHPKKHESFSDALRALLPP